MKAHAIATVGVALALVLAVTACRSDDEGGPANGETSGVETTSSSAPAPPSASSLPEDAATLLWQGVNDEDYTSWDAAPGFTARRPAAGPHGDEVMVFVNDAVADRLRKQDAGGLPADSVLVKDVYTNGSLDAIAIMQKTDDLRWYWAEYDTDGTIIAEGLEIALCADCHSEGKDFVRSFDVP
ncbi:MAG: hypothetical protein OEV43_04230 [Coriobacteriia bacterium]|nr:hypothetical protein [Coriobacteriia bacterium]